MLKIRSVRHVNTLLFGISRLIERKPLAAHFSFRHRTPEFNLRSYSSMGATWSRNTVVTTEPEVVQLVTAGLDSPSVANFCEPLELSVTLQQDDWRRIQRDFKVASWVVEFEVDVAHLQEKHTLLIQSTDLSNVTEKIVVPQSAFVDLIEVQGLGLDDLCNIGAFHIQLLVGDAHEKLLANVSLVVGIAREGFESEVSHETLTRRVYGAVSKIPRAW